jgi:hypothetical protein
MSTPVVEETVVVPAAPVVSAETLPAPAAPVVVPPPVDELAPIPRRPVMSADALRAVQDATRSIRVQRNAAESSITLSAQEEWWNNVLKHTAELHLNNIGDQVAAAARIAAQEDQSYCHFELTWTRNIDYASYVEKFPRSRAAITYKTCARDRGNSVHLDAAFAALKIEFARRVLAKNGVRDACALIRHEMPGVKCELRPRMDPDEAVVIHVSWKKERKTIMNRMKKWVWNPMCQLYDRIPFPTVIF